MQPLGDHFLTQNREVVLSGAVTRHRLTLQEVVAGVALADGKLKARHSRFGLGHLDQPSMRQRQTRCEGGWCGHSRVPVLHLQGAEGSLCMRNRGGASSSDAPAGAPLVATKRNRRPRLGHFDDGGSGRAQYRHRGHHGRNFRCRPYNRSFATGVPPALVPRRFLLRPPVRPRGIRLVNRGRRRWAERRALCGTHPAVNPSSLARWGRGRSCRHQQGLGQGLDGGYGGRNRRAPPVTRLDDHPVRRSNRL